MASCLIVEDEPSLVYILSLLLQADGHTVLSAGTLAAAQDLLQRQAFDLVLLDLKLQQRLDGLDMLQVIRQTDSWRKTKVIVLTAVVEAQDEARAAGADAVVLKPFDVPQLRALVSRLVVRPKTPSGRLKL